MKTALFPGSFDPFTIGHLSIAKRALPYFDRLIIAIGYNVGKQGFIPVEERAERIRTIFADDPRVEVRTYSNLTVDFAREVGAACIVRGVRSVSDFESERTLADVNRSLTGIETLLLIATPELAHISSSMVRELAAFGHDITPYLP